VENILLAGEEFLKKAEMLNSSATLRNMGIFLQNIIPEKKLIKSWTMEYQSGPQ
jgi:hypothetical protein